MGGDSRFFRRKCVSFCGFLPSMLRLVGLMVGMGLAPAALRADNGADFFVSTEGNDAWSGTLAEPNPARSDGPVATIPRAQDLVRQRKQAEPVRAKPFVVAIRGGTYFLGKPLEFTPQDSGTERAPVIYEAYGQERPVLSGGVRISGLRPGSDGRWHATLDAVKKGQWSFSQLWVDDQQRQRPRLPKQGYFKIAQSVPRGPATKGQGDDRFGYSADDLRPDWTNRGEIEVVTFHEWATSRLRIASIDTEQHTVTLAGHTCSTSAWAALKKGYRYLVENVREALSEPGQWYLDRPSGELTYIPLTGELPDRTVVIAPRLERLMTLAGDVPGRRWVQHVQFRGLTLAHSNWVMPAQGQAFPQADINVDAAVSSTGARNIVFEGCAIRHVGGYAMAFGLGCRDNRVERCEMVDLGAGGIKIGHTAGHAGRPGGMAEGGPEEIVSNHTIRECTIAHGGRIHPAGIGVWIGHSPYNIVEHNDIFDFYYTGISVGWVWGYAPSKAHHNDIGFNHVHTIGQRVLSDMGGIYTLGVSPGTRVHDNCFHDVQSFSYGGWGLYTDEGSSEIVMENNLIYRTKTGGFHQHYGRENRIVNNIFAFAADQQIQRTRTEPHTSFVFERNIVYWDNASPLLGSNWKDNHFKLDNNIYWNTTGTLVLFPGKLSLDDWRKQRGQDLQSIVADPGFVAPEQGDFRLKADSPALKVGFKPFDFAKAGRTSPFVLTKGLPPVPKGFE